VGVEGGTMEVEHVPAETRQARTTYRLTEEEIVSALSDYVLTIKHKLLPKGKVRVLYDGGYCQSNLKASLVIDHAPPDCGCSRCVVARVKGTPASADKRQPVLKCMDCGYRWGKRPDETNNFICLTPIAQCCPMCGGLRGG
jgi:hypothetical protein